MKRIVDGVTYNTDTSTLVARWEYKDEQNRDTEADLFQTRLGAFFIVHEWYVSGQPKYYFEAISRDAVQQLIVTRDNITIINEDLLQEPPEEADESAPSATLYIRIPASLKAQLDASAARDGVSLNAWTMRCAERCKEMDKVRAHLGEILQTGLSSEAGCVDSGMVEHMYEHAQEVAKLLGWRGKELEDLATDASSAAASGYPGIHRRWRFPEEGLQGE